MMEMMEMSQVLDVIDEKQTDRLWLQKLCTTPPRLYFSVYI